jgi:predicted AAA+ superfamily ATPase
MEVMKVEELKRVLADQREVLEEYLRRERIIERIFPDRLLRALSHPNILAILGVRRCGKSTFSHLLLRGEKYGYVNFDDERLAGLNTDDLDRVLQALYELHGPLDFLLLDEVHNVPGWELFASRLRMTKRVVITGSNAKLLSGELATHLTGRYLDFVLFPFSFREFLAAKEIEVEPLSTAKTAEIKSALEEYLRVGGFPEVLKFGRMVLGRIYEDIIYKDVLRRFRPRERADFGEVARYVLSNFSKEITFSKLKNLFGLGSVRTVKGYVDHLALAYLIFTVERFSPRLKERMIAPRKVYCVDTGILNTVTRFSEDRGRLMENLIYIEMLRRGALSEEPYQVFYWKDHQQREVDFVIVKGWEVEALIQATYACGRDEVEERELKALLKASEELHCKNLTLLTWDYYDELDMDGVKISCLPLWKWLLE